MIGPHRAELSSRTEVLNDGWLSTVVMCRVCGEHVLTFRSPLGANHSPAECDCPAHVAVRETAERLGRPILPRGSGVAAIPSTEGPEAR